MQNSYMQACTKPVSESYSTQRRCVTAATVVSHTTDFLHSRRARDTNSLLCVYSVKINLTTGYV